MYKEFKTQLNKTLSNSLRPLKILDELKVFDDSAFHSIVSEYVLSSGKRVRPLLFLSAYKGYCHNPGGQEFDLEAAMGVAVTLELMHNFALIHDDLIDKSLTRRGRPSLQVSFDQLLDCEGGGGSCGNDLALLAGDILYSLAIENYTRINLAPQIKEAALQELLRSAIKTGCGVFAEVYLRSCHEALSCEQIMRLYKNKTTYYSFTCPLKMAAILAQAGESEISRLSDFAESIGLAYQINDDINDLNMMLKDSSPLPTVHAQEIRTMLPYYYLYRESDSKGRKWLEKMSLTRDSEIRRFKGMLGESGAITLAQNKLNDCWEEARIKFKFLELSSQIKEMLFSLFSESLALQTVGAQHA